jgi:hypothetical protein
MSIIINSLNNTQFSPHTINTTASLSSSVIGQEVICTGSSAYTITLPAVAANLYFDVFCQTTSHAIVTLSPASGTIAGQTNIALGSGDGVRIMSDGTNWWVLQNWLQPASFSATKSTTTAITSAGIVTIKFDTKSSDIGGFYDTSTYTYTPLLPGIYNFTANSAFASNAGTNYTSKIFLNQSGTIVSQDVQFLSSGTFVFQNIVNQVLSMNGSTDYILISATQNSGSSVNINSTGTDLGTFQGTRIALF